jgi:hypothetical protein
LDYYFLILNRLYYKGIISKELYIKCSNLEIREKLSHLSIEEKKLKLKDKLNPAEKDDYDDILDELDCLSIFDEDSMDDDIRSEIMYYQDQLFQYDKRIYRGYDFDKNKDNVPSYNLNDYKEESPHDSQDDTILPLEERQISIQEPLSNHQEICLMSYFGNDDYKNINGELMDNDYWNSLDETEQYYAHATNKHIRNGVDSAIRNSKGLLENMVLYHGTGDSGLISIHARIGDHLTFKPYISTSFNKNVGENYKGDSFLVKFLVPKGTKGICANDTKFSNHLTDYVNEHEYLLGRGNKGTIVDIDYGSMMVTVLLE